MPVSAGILSSNACSASRPPAEAPIPTTGNLAVGALALSFCSDAGLNGSSLAERLLGAGLFGATTFSFCAADELREVFFNATRAAFLFLRFLFLAIESPYATARPSCTGNGGPVAPIFGMDFERTPTIRTRSASRARLLRNVERETQTEELVTSRHGITCQSRDGLRGGSKTRSSAGTQTRSRRHHPSKPSTFNSYCT